MRELFLLILDLGREVDHLASVLLEFRPLASDFRLHYGMRQFTNLAGSEPFDIWIDALCSLICSRTGCGHWLRLAEALQYPHFQTWGGLDLLTNSL